MPESALTYTHEPLSTILPELRRALAAGSEVAFTVPDPDAGVGLYAGEAAPHGVHRPWAVWAEVADLLGAHLLTPERADGGRVIVRLRAFTPTPDPDAAGYGAGGDWARVDKLEDPTFLVTFVEALRRVAPLPGGRVLSLGVNAGRELDALALAFPGRAFDVHGVDLDASALEAARRRHPAATFHQFDVAALLHPAPAHPSLRRFDVIMILSLLQSPGIRQDVLLAALKKHHLTPTGGLILGYPNARYRDGTLSPGARMRNFARPDYSLLMSEVTDARRSLHGRGFKVFVTGRHEILVTAIPAGVTTPTGLEL